ncbi:hypothetical protein F5884DRAFT_304396 [Xylogone sp. PMI_703]|nr:hypothetical protein F5884DRAFT_304396 [Xylogone sp. PMI_703]
MPYVRACNRCHKVKEKCIFDPSSTVCRRCKKLKATCEINRRQSRLGRRPTVKVFGPECIVQVWSSQRPGSEISRPRKEKPSPVEKKAPSVTSTVSEPDSSSIIELEESHNTADFTLFPRSEPVPDNVTELLRECILDANQFYEANRRYLIGPTFARDFHAALQSIYFWAPAFVQHAYLAALGSMHRARNNVSTVDEVDLARGAVALHQLRTVIIRGIRDAEAVIILGQVLAAVDIFTTSTRAHLIVGHTLSIIKPWYPELAKEERLDCITITPILIDTVECLIRREVPAIKLSVRHAHQIDRTAGLCTTLIPLLYELCELSYQAKLTGSIALDSEGGDIFTEIEGRIRAWDPSTPENFSEAYLASEILVMLSQARTYRLAALLIIHRLRYPFGMNDGPAATYANLILSDLSQCLTLLKDGVKVRNSAFPLLVAMLEVPVDEEATLGKFEDVDPPSSYTANLLAFVRYVRRIKEERRFTGVWFDLVSRGPEFCVLP